MTTILIDKVQDFLEKQEKVYLELGEKAPEETVEQIGPKGGRYYLTTPKMRAIKPADWNKWTTSEKMDFVRNLSGSELYPFVYDEKISIRCLVAQLIDQEGLRKMRKDFEENVRVVVAGRISRKFLTEMYKDKSLSVRFVVSRRFQAIDTIGAKTLVYFEKFHRLPENLPKFFVKAFDPQIVLGKSPALKTKPIIEELYRETPFDEVHPRSVEQWEDSSNNLLSGLLKDSIGRNYNGEIKYHKEMSSQEIEKELNEGYRTYARELVDEYTKVHKALMSRLLDIAFPNKSEFTLYRGTTGEEIEKGEEISIKQNPISSWTLDESVAQKFAITNENGIVLEAKIPKDDIWSTFVSHAYEGNEHEILVIGKPKRIAKVVWSKE